MTTVLEPRAGHGDVVGGGLAVALEEDRDVGGILTVPGLERLKELETVGGGGDNDRNGSTIGGRSLVGVLARVVSAVGKTGTAGGREVEVVSVLVLDGVGQGVEVQGSGNGEGRDQVRGGDKGVGLGVGVVTAGEVTVVRRQDGVGSSLGNISAIPLTNAGSAGVGKDNTAELLESGKLAITLNGGADLLGTGGNGLSAVVSNLGQ